VNPVPVAVVAQAPQVNPADPEPEDVITEIIDEEVPLAVVDNDVEVIEEESAPLADGIEKPADGLKNWWWWIAAGVAGIAGKGAYDAGRRKYNRNKDNTNK